MDSYGAANPNTNSSGFQPNMRLPYSTDAAAVYRPLMPPPPYQDGGNGSSVAPPQHVDGGVNQAKKKRGRPRKYSVVVGGNIYPSPSLQVEAVYPSGGGTDGFPVAVADGEASQEGKKQRGRPRKSAVERGSMQQEAAVYQPSGLSSPSGNMQLEVAGLSSPSTLAIPVGSSGKKSRGRPKVAKGRKQQQVASKGSAAVEFTTHVLTVQAGEDICHKIISFCENPTSGICVLSANGAVSNATLRQPETSGGTVTYEGRFEIIRLSGSFMLLENGVQRSRAGGLSVVLAGADGSILGGDLAGVITAATPVQIVVFSFVPCAEDSKSPTQAGPSTAPPNPVPGASAGGSPISWGTMSDSSGGPGSPLNQTTGAYDNNDNQHDMNNLSWLN